MAIKANQADSKMVIVYNAGVDDDNKTIVKTKTFANVKAEIENEDLYNLGLSISDLQVYQLSNIVRHDEYELVDEI